MNSTPNTPEVKTDQLGVAVSLEEHPEIAHDLQLFAMGYLAGKQAQAHKTEE